jgi:hypothetical protein
MGDEQIEQQVEQLREQVASLQIENQKLRNDVIDGADASSSSLIADLMAENEKLKKERQEFMLSDSSGIVAVPDPREESSKPHLRVGTANSMGTRGTSRGADMEVLNLRTRIRDLEGELQMAYGLAEDIALLKKKMEQLAERNRVEKEKSIKAESEGGFAKKKMEILADQLEKLMTHLKHEAAAKVRTQEQMRVNDRMLVEAKERLRVTEAKSSAKDRLVLELREGAKILEDQLRLMDEKYLELRGKLDWARENGEKKIQQAQRKANELRKKFALMGGGPLDKIQLPGLNGGDSQSVSFRDSLEVGSSIAMDSVGSKRSQKGGKRGKGMNQSQASKGSGDSVIAEPSLDSVMEKIRRHQGGQREWTDDNLRDLAKSR